MRPAAERREDLVELLREMREEHECPLAATRTKLVFGAGNADAELMFVGEAPGANEDREGLPFVGRAGKLLDTLLGEIGLERGDVWVGNVLKCRPPANRDPLPAEIEICKPYLFRQIDLIEPRLICTLGNFATRCLTGRPEGITKVHGEPQLHELGGRPVRVYPLLHPAAALRTPAMLETLREDIGRIPSLLGEPLPGPVGQRPEPAGGDAPPSAPGPAPQLDLF